MALPAGQIDKAVFISGTYPDLHYAADFGWYDIIDPDEEISWMTTQDHLHMLTEPHIEALRQHLQTALIAARADDVQAQKQ